MCEASQPSDDSSLCSLFLRQPELDVKDRTWKPLIEIIL